MTAKVATRRFDQLFLWATALVFLAFGLWGLLAPGQMMARFGVALTDRAGKTAIRATYGGFLFGGGVLMAYCAMASGRLRFGLRVVLVLSGATLLARVMGMLVDRSASAYHLTYASREIAGVLISGARLLGEDAPRA